MKTIRNILLFTFLTGIILFISCTKDKSEKFKLLTDHAWRSDSLLVNGVDASGASGLLNKFVGDVRFNSDGTGNFGSYTGTWMFTSNETKLTISSDSLLIPITANIAELTSSSLKITTSYPNIANPALPLNVRMTFKPK